MELGVKFGSGFNGFCSLLASFWDTLGSLFDNLGPVGTTWGVTGQPRWTLAEIMCDFGANPGPKGDPK